MAETAQKILVAFDDSTTSHKAFDFAMGLVKNGLGGSITVISVVQAPDLVDVPIDIEPMIASARAKLEAAQLALKEKAKAIQQTITTVCVVGHAAEAIVDYAQQKGYDMIVLGNRGRSKVAAWLLGSVSQLVAAHARCTVTIVK